MRTPAKVLHRLSTGFYFITIRRSNKFIHEKTERLDNSVFICYLLGKRSGRKKKNTVKKEKKNERRKVETRRD